MLTWKNSGGNSGIFFYCYTVLWGETGRIVILIYNVDDYL